MPTVYLTAPSPQPYRKALTEAIEQFMQRHEGEPVPVLQSCLIEHRGPGGEDLVLPETRRIAEDIASVAPPGHVRFLVLHEAACVAAIQDSGLRNCRCQSPVVQCVEPL